MSKSSLPPSVRSQILRNRNRALFFALLDALVTGTAAYLTATGSLWWLLLAAGFLVPLALNAALAVRAQAALNLYKSSPAAAYLAEIRNAFGVK